MNKKQTRSTRRNNTDNQGFHELSFERGKQKKQTERKRKKIIEAEQMKMEEQPQNVVTNEIFQKSVLFNQQQNQTEFQAKSNNYTQAYKQTGKRTNKSKRKSKKLGLHHQAIANIIKQLEGHPAFPIMLKTRLRPSTKAQIQRITQSINNNNAEYSLIEFQQDVCKLFNSFHQKSGQSQQILSTVKQLRSQLIQKIKYLQKNYQDIAQSSQFNSQSLRRSNRSAKPTPKAIPEQFYLLPKKKTPKRQKQSNEVSNSEQKRKKSRGQSKKINRRPLDAKITLQQIAAIGFNIRKLESKDLQEICLTYCSDSDERTQGKNVYYSLDLQKLSKPVLFQIQAHVKNLLKQRNLQYEQVHQSSEQDFVIEDDQ